MPRRKNNLIKLLTVLLCIILSLSILSGCRANSCEHTEGTWIVDTEATLDSEGSRHTECIECGETIRTETIPELSLTYTQLRTKLSKSLVKVCAYDYDGTTLLSQGSGFFINKTGTFITNAHVVEDCYYLKVKYKYSTYDVKSMHIYNSTLDYALCKIDSYITTTPVEFSDVAEIGDTVYAIGYPDGILSLTQGMITSTTTKDGLQDFYESTAKIDHGSSGGILADAKGRVLGITTGEFSNGQYASLKYSEFKKDISNRYSVTKAPLNYFHKVQEVNLYSYNVDDYFDIYITGTATSNTRVSYSVTVAIKDRYAKKKILIDSIGVRITLKLDTEYEYYEVGTYIDSRRTKIDSTYVSFCFYNKNDLINGDWQSASSSIFISSFTDYYGMRISYETDFFSCSGTMLIYD